MKTGSRKVEDGKLVKVEYRYTDRIEDVKIHGDFFIRPPEALKEIEKQVEGLELEEKEIVEAVKSVDAELTGFSAEDIAKALINAKRGEKE